MAENATTGLPRRLRGGDIELLEELQLGGRGAAQATRVRQLEAEIA